MTADAYAASVDDACATDARTCPAGHGRYVADEHVGEREQQRTHIGGTERSATAGTTADANAATIELTRRSHAVNHPSGHQQKQRQRSAGAASREF